MLTTILFAAAIVAGPVLIALASLALVGAIVAGLADGVAGDGLVRPRA